MEVLMNQSQGRLDENSAGEEGYNLIRQLELLIPAVSARILKTSTDTLDEVIYSSLQEIIQLLKLSRGGLLEVSEGICKVKISHAWFDVDVEVVPNTIDLSQLFPWSYRQLVRDCTTVAITSLDSLPAEAATDKQSFAQMGVQSSLTIPLLIGHRVHHLIVVHAVKQQWTWPEPLITSLRLLGEIFVSALDRRDVFRSLEIYQARLEIAAVSAEVGLWELDPVTGNIWATNSAKVLFEFGQDEQITLSNLLDKIHPDDRSLVVETVDKAIDADTESYVEYRLPRADGEIRWLLSRGRVHQKGATASKYLVGVTADITSRKQMEHKLHEQFREINRLRELLEHENTLLRSEVGLNEDKYSFLSVSSAMQGVKLHIEQVANTGSTVLIQGETGTGKELVAQAIHRLSDRSKRLMVTVNCAALPSALIESELFGREKGAFTGALSRQKGRFELAHESTLFLDEIAEMPLETQAKLLRALQNGVFERLGSPVSIKVDVRIIAATNRNLYEEVEEGRFRRDLYYRLNIFPIQVPPLRDRVEDIPPLVWKFVSEFGQNMGRKISRIASQDMARLMAYSWPGNVRELRNVVERAMITSQGKSLDLTHFDLAPPRPLHPSIMTLEEVECRHIQDAIGFTSGKIKGKGGAAEILGLHPSTLYSRMRKLNIQCNAIKLRGDISSL
ncbi:sigma 54-interacting transcriptional regulator [Desulfoprunum benzoelyticum]|uniref:PAS domain S-box-containing protein n=1 Tax=Desulfoprunum benzoelyticum TaxID=1506996 RepID=A0A840UZU5_9BACT|nr:sigma 54-interacting transcriptional regulator [Desulfoprunum benzoelyticum]MBB5348168.1 PAS domain S-box-containing protein [Desulfoprunum benzoelyticum]MBM9530904.1 sigma 54-interacting transcriptional regulator [Desulfoprunum benzoelyticum]